MECRRRTIDLKHYSMNTSEYAPHLCRQVNRKINILKAQIIYYKYVINIKPPNIGHKLIDFFLNTKRHLLLNNHRPTVPLN